jgi:hypothetical protein
MVNEPLSFQPETPADLVFDDDPIESVLYESSPIPPTEASIFGPSHEFMEKFRDAMDSGSDLNVLVGECNRFLDEHPPSAELLGELCGLVELLVKPETLITDEVREFWVRLTRLANRSTSSNPGTDK